MKRSRRLNPIPKELLMEVAHKFVKPSYKKRFYYDALNHPHRLDERVSHHSEYCFIHMPDPDEIILSHDIKCWVLNGQGWRLEDFSEYKKDIFRSFAIAEDASFICADIE